MLINLLSCLLKIQWKEEDIVINVKYKAFEYFDNIFLLPFNYRLFLWGRNSFSAIATALQDDASAVLAQSILISGHHFAEFLPVEVKRQRSSFSGGGCFIPRYLYVASWPVLIDDFLKNYGARPLCLLTSTILLLLTFSLQSGHLLLRISYW